MWLMIVFALSGEPVIVEAYVNRHQCEVRRATVELPTYLSACRLAI